MKTIARNFIVIVLATVFGHAIAFGQGGCDSCDGQSVSVNLSASPSTVAYGTPVTLSVSTAPGASGTIYFYRDNNTYLGQASLSQSTGNATFSVGTISTGHHTFVAYYSGDGNYYGGNSSQVSETVNRAIPHIIWPPLSPVMSGTTITTSQLNASASIAGSFTYSPASGTVPTSGIQVITASFTPSDATDYTPTTYANSLIVEPAAPSSSSTSALSPNSGINSQDTFAIMDVTTQTAGSVNAAAPGGVAQGSSVPSATPVADVIRSYRMEMGFDANGSPVLNILPPLGQTGLTSNTDTVSSIRYSGGQLTAFDINGNPLSIVPPNSNINTAWPLNPQALSSGFSLLRQMSIPNIQTYASQTGATLTMNGNQSQLTRSAGASGQIAFLYNQSGSGWLLQGLSTATIDQSGSSANQMLFANVTYQDNSQSDSARTTVGHMTPRANSALTNAIPAQSSATQAPCGSACAGTQTVNNFGGSQNVLFQHGFHSSGDTWNRMTGWLNQDFLFGNEVVTSLASTAPLSDQGQNLESLIQQAGGNQYILIGHSQGGLISRSAAQYFQSNNSSNTLPLVQAVITVDTPHLGAALTQTAPNAIGQELASLTTSLYGETGCFSPDDNFGCYFAAAVYYGADTFSQSLIDSVGSLNDLTPGSQFLNQLNMQNENFSRASITGETDQRWLVMRTVTSLFPVNPDDTLGERNLVLIPEIFYDLVSIDLGFAVLNEADWFDYCVFGDGSYNGDPYCDYDFLGQIVQDTSILTTMNKIDSFYDNLIAPTPGDGSDGFVQNSSQFYPSSSATKYVIPHADSHAAATKSPYDHYALDYLLSTVYKVQTPPPCSFSSTNMLIVVPQAGGSFSAPFTTTAACQWSAISTSPWITINPSSVSGTGANSVSFSVSPLMGSVPRSGTIVIGNGTSNVTITINQLSSSSANCNYALAVIGGSRGYCTSFDLGGGSAQLQVSTQTGCAWSASSDSSWLTTQNGSGVGSGTFTVNLAASSIRRQGTINVMGQTRIFSEEQTPPPSGSCGNGGNNY